MISFQPLFFQVFFSASILLILGLLFCLLLLLNRALMLFVFLQSFFPLHSSDWSISINLFPSSLTLFSSLPPTCCWEHIENFSFHFISKFFFTAPCGAGLIHRPILKFCLLHFSIPEFLFSLFYTFHIHVKRL